MSDNLFHLKKTLLNNLNLEIKQKKFKKFILSADHFEGILLASFSANKAGVSIASQKFIKAALALQIVYQNLLAKDEYLDNIDLSTVAKEEFYQSIHENKILNYAHTLSREVKNKLFLENFSQMIADTTEGRILAEKKRRKKLSFLQYQKISQLKKGSLFNLFFSFPFFFKEKKYKKDLPAIIALGKRMGLFHQYLEDFLDYSMFIDLHHHQAPFKNYQNQKWTLPCFFIPLFTWGKDLNSFLIYLLEHPLVILEEVYQSFLKKQIQWLNKKAKLFFLDEQYSLFTALLKHWTSKINKAIYLEKKYKLMFTNLKKQFLPISDAAILDNKKMQDSFILLENFVDAKGHLKKKWLTVFTKGDLIHYNFFSCWRFLLTSPKKSSFFAIMLLAHLLNDIKNNYREDRHVDLFFYIWKVLIQQAYQHQITIFPFLAFLVSESKRTAIPLKYLFLILEAKKKEINHDIYPAYYLTKKDLYRTTLNFGGVLGLWLFKNWFFNLAVKNIAQSNQIILTFARAIQLTEILRTMSEDLKNEKLYLPLDILKENQISLADLIAEQQKLLLNSKDKANSSLSGFYRKMLANFIDEIESHYRYCFQRIAYLPPSLHKPLVIVGFLYRGILLKISKRNHDNLSRPITLSWWDKSKQVIKAFCWLVKIRKK